MALLKPEYIQETSREVGLLIELWLKVRNYLQRALSTEPITKEDEQDFLRVKSDGTKYHRILKGKLTDQKTRIKRLDFAYDKMIDILRGSISIAHLRSLPESDVKRSLSEWHRIFVQLNNIGGAYEFLGSDQINLSRAAKRSGDGGGVLGKIKSLLKDKRVLAVLAVLIIGGVVAFVMSS